MKAEVEIYLTDEDLERLHQIDDGESLVEWFNDVAAGDWEESSKLESVVGYLAEDRYTLDNDSCKVIDVKVADFPALSGSIEVEYTVSCYLGCKDMDVVADERDATVRFRVEPETGQLILETEIPEPRYPIDEF